VNNFPKIDDVWQFNLTYWLYGNQPLGDRHSMRREFRQRWRSTDSHQSSISIFPRNCSQLYSKIYFYIKLTRYTKYELLYSRGKCQLLHQENTFFYLVLCWVIFVQITKNCLQIKKWNSNIYPMDTHSDIHPLALLNALKSCWRHLRIFRSQTYAVLTLCCAL